MEIKNALADVFLLSGHPDLNRGPLAPHASTLAKLRHAPNVEMQYNSQADS